MKQNLEYFSYPLPEDIEKCVIFGDYEMAGRMIDRRLADPKIPQAQKERLLLEKQFMQVRPEVYTLSADDVYYQLVKLVKDFRKEEFQELSEDGTLDWIMLNGQKCFMNNCVDSFLKTRVDYYDRILDQTFLQNVEKTASELNAVIAKVKEEKKVSIRYHVKETLRIHPKAQRPGERIRVWMPAPVNDLQCRSMGKIHTDPQAAYIASAKEKQRTIYFEEVYRENLEFTARFAFQTETAYVQPDPELVSKEQPDFYTGEEYPQIVFTPYIKALAKELMGEETNPLKIARKFYDYVTCNTCYRYVPPYKLKTNIPEYFGAGMRGDCGMHALTFITLCRCAGIPARWQAGWYTKPGSVGNHDWAVFYVEPYGWLFADGSFGGGAYRSGDLDRWNFYFGNLEPWRMVANADVQEEFDPPFPFLRVDPYDNQMGEAAWDDRALSLTEYSIERTIESWEIV